MTPALWLTHTVLSVHGQRPLVSQRNICGFRVSYAAPAHSTAPCLHREIECLRRVEQLANGNVEAFHHVDVRDKAALDAVFKQHDVAAVIHFAGGSMLHPRTAHPCACACSGIAVAPVMALEAASLHGPTVGLKAVGESVEKPLLYYQVNLEGMLNLVQELIPRFVTAG